jgi:hypothetical protein
VSRESGPAGGSTPLGDLLERLGRLLEPDLPRLIVVRTRDRAASAALVERVLDRHRGAAVVVVHPPEAAQSLYHPKYDATRTWSILTTTDALGSIEMAARTMGVASTVFSDAADDLRVRRLWLPQRILEGYAVLPASTDGVLVVDDWRALVTDYLSTGERRSAGLPDAEELDRLLGDAFHALSESHLMVITSGRSKTLEGLATAVLEVRRKGGSAGVEISFLRDPLEHPRSAPYHLHLDPTGVLE